MLGSAGWLGAATCLAMHLLFCGACAHRWTFDRPSRLVAKPPGRTSDPFLAHRQAPVAASPDPVLRLPRTPEQQDGLVTQASHFAPPEANAAGLPTGYTGQSGWVQPPGPAWQASDFEPSVDTFPTRVRRGRLRRRFRGAGYKILADYRDYYSWENVRDLLLGVSAASVFANTSMDHDIRDWYQDDVRNADLDDCASFCKVFGEGEIFISSFAAMALAEGLIDLEEGQPGYQVGVLSSRVTRAYLVGAPPLLFMQACLGGSRPKETNYESSWRSFEDNNAVSGHAFVGAVPFLTAGRMIEQEHPCAAGCLYFCSALPGWSRVNDDAHYFSQVCLGWWMAYLACRSVDHTEDRYQNLSFTPLAMNNAVGISATYRR